MRITRSQPLLAALLGGSCLLVSSLAFPRPAFTLSTRIALTDQGISAGDNLGTSVAPIGDLDGDGYDDVAVGMPQGDAPDDLGFVYVYYGGSAPTGQHFTFHGHYARERYGFSIASAGDVNGDGFLDLIVGAPSCDAGGVDRGRAYVYFTGPLLNHDAPDLLLSGEAPGDAFGHSVASAGDMNNDGYSDIIVGAPGYDDGGTAGGRVYVYLGGPNPDAVADLTITGSTSANYYIGAPVASAGDVNGDGYDDIILGVAGGCSVVGTHLGGASVYFGGLYADAIPDWVIPGSTWDFGKGVSSAGNFDRIDGDDILVTSRTQWPGIPCESVGRSAVFTSGFGWDAIPDWTSCGDSGAPAGDVNADGYDDIIVGCEGYFLYDGRAIVAFGGLASGWTNNTQKLLEGYDDPRASSFGRAVASAGDFCGNGFDDLVVGAPLEADRAGRVYVFDTLPTVSVQTFLLCVRPVWRPICTDSIGVATPWQIVFEGLNTGEYDLKEWSYDMVAFEATSRCCSLFVATNAPGEWAAIGDTVILVGQGPVFDNGDTGPWVAELKIAVLDSLAVDTLYTLVERDTFVVVPGVVDATVPSYGSARVLISPNPCFGATDIWIDAGEQALVDVKVLDVSGRLVRQVLVSAEMRGQRFVRWDGRDHNGRQVRPGVYLCLAKIDGVKVVKRMVLMR